MPVEMPTSPPYAPLAEPPWADQWPPPPPAPPLPPVEPERGKPRRTVATALVVVVSLLCAAFGFEVGGALFGTPASTNPRVTRTAPAPTIPGGATPAPGSSSAVIADKVTPAVVDINTTVSNGAAAGTGMVLTSDGLVLTNNHVIADASDIRVQIAGTGPTYKAKVLGYSIADDVALLQLDGASGLTSIDIGSSSTVHIGDQIVAIGNALGRGGDPSVVQGRVTDLHQTITAGDATGGAPAQTLADLIEVSAPLLPGDSGGPLVDQNAKVVGMNTAASSTNRRRATGDGYAIPIETALAIAHQIEAGQGSDRVHIGERALLGVRVQEGAQGVTVAGVEPNTPAASAGLTAGDVIVSVESTPIHEYADLPAALNPYHPGDRVEIAWNDASGQHHTASVQLIAGPPA